MLFIWSESGQKEKQGREHGRKKNGKGVKKKKSVSKQQLSAAAKFSGETGSEIVGRRPALVDLTGPHYVFVITNIGSVLLPMKSFSLGSLEKLPVRDFNGFEVNLAKTAFC